jgi:hypothetical protein
VFYFFQTRDFVSIKTLIISFLIISVLNTAFISVYLIKPRSKDIDKYMIVNPGLRYRYKLYKNRDILLAGNYLVKYRGFNEKKNVFIDLTLIHIDNGTQIASPRGKIIKSEQKYYLHLTNPYSLTNNKRINFNSIKIFENIKTNPFFKKTFHLYHTLNKEYIFYNYLLNRQKNKKNIWHYLNNFLILMGITAIFMVFGLLYSIESHRIVNISISIAILPIIYIAIYFIYKIPVHKINFLKKGFLININTGLVMFAITLILFVIALFRVRSNST